MIIYSNGIAVYHVWNEKSLGSRIGGELYIGQLSPEGLKEFLTVLKEAGIFTVEALPGPTGDAPYYAVSASFGGKNASVTLSESPQTTDGVQLLDLVRETSDFRDWATRRGDFQEFGVFSPTEIRLQVQLASSSAPAEWPLSEVPLEDGSILSGELSDAVRRLIPLGWFGHYSYRGSAYVVGFLPRYPHGWP